MVLVVDRTSIAERLSRYPNLAGILDAEWIERNLHDPLWLPPIHPLMVWLWSDHHYEYLATLDADIALLTERQIDGRRGLRIRLKDARQFRTAVPELLLGGDLLRAGYHLSLPAAKGVKNPDLRISRDGETLDVEITAFEQTRDVQDLNIMLTVLREGEPYVYERAIPDTAKFERGDILRAGEEIRRIFAGKRFRSGMRTVRIGASGYEIVIKPDVGQGSGSYSAFALDPSHAACKVNERLKHEAVQLPAAGGAVVLDISTADVHVSRLHVFLEGEPSVRNLIWRDVPTHVHTLWLYRWRGEDGKPLEVSHSANPHANVAPSPLVRELCMGPLREGYFPYRRKGEA